MSKVLVATPAEEGERKWNKEEERELREHGGNCPTDRFTSFKQQKTFRSCIKLADLLIVRV